MKSNSLASPSPIESERGRIAQVIYRCISVFLLCGFIILLLSGSLQSAPFWLVTMPFVLLGGLDLATWMGGPPTIGTARAIWGTVLFHAVVIGTVAGGHWQMSERAMPKPGAVEPQALVQSLPAPPALPGAPSSSMSTGASPLPPGYTSRQPTAFPPRPSSPSPTSVGPVVSSGQPAPTTSATKTPDITAAIKRAAELKAAKAALKPGSTPTSPVSASGIPQPVTVPTAAPAPPVTAPASAPTSPSSPSPTSGSPPVKPGG